MQRSDRYCSPILPKNANETRNFDVFEPGRSRLAPFEPPVQRRGAFRTGIEVSFESVLSNRQSRPPERCVSRNYRKVQPNAEKSIAARSFPPPLAT